MSLLATVDAANASATQSYFIKDLSTDGLTPKIGTNAAGTVLIQNNPVGSVVTIRPDLAAAGNMRLGASATSFQNVVLSDALTTVNTTLAMGVGAAINAQSLNVAGNSLFTSSIDINNQQIQNNLRYTQAFTVADGTNDVSPGTAQPALIAGSYAIFVQVTGNPQIQPSCVGYWNGAIWSAGANGAAFTYPGGNVAVGIRPAAGGASLVMSNGSGASISGFIYYCSLGEN